MGRVVVVGELGRVAGFALAGADVRPAEDEIAVRAAWRAAGERASVVVLTPNAARILASQVDGPPTPSRPLVVVLP
jgi:vacuolar-type H+-ATPase subunit F/Vma7